MPPTVPGTVYLIHELSILSPEMSGICGIINFDGQPVERSLLEKMANNADYRGKDGIRYWINAEIGFAHLALHTTPESRRENQPLVHRQHGLVLVADARIDDRQALIKKIRGKNIHVNGSPTDAALILAAYITWGADCPGYLLGDFAFVVWDSTNREVFAGRDRGGCRGLYYRRTTNGIRFATQASQLIIDPDYRQVLNRQLLARDLILPGFSGQHQSYYQGIEKLGPAETFQMTADNFTRKKYWQLNADVRVIYKNPQEYSDHFRALFKQCVSDRLRCEGDTGLFLSGGLDSSSIAAMAGYEIAENPSTVTSNLKCVNWTYGENHVANEVHYGQCAASRWNLDFEEMSMLEFPPLYDYPWRKPHDDEPYNSPISSFFTATLEKFTKINNPPKVWMTGFYGDLLVGGQNPFFYSDLFAQGKFIEAFKHISAQKKAYKLNWQQALLISYFFPLVIRPLKQKIHHFRKGNRVYARDWIMQELIDETRVCEWAMDMPAPEWVNTRARHDAIHDPALAFRFRMLNCNISERLRVWFERTFAQFHAECWSPWDDSRLPEFMLSIPQNQIARGLDHKLILRNSMKGLLPPALLERRELRTGPGVYLEQSFRSRVKPAVGSLTSDMVSERLKIINSGILKHHIDRYFAGKSSYDKILWLTLSLESWLQERDF